MTDEGIRKIVKQYRKAIEEACRDGKFGSDLGFKDFPLGSCGDTCSLLAQHLLLKYNTKTLWVSAERGIDSHAWLVLKDDRITGPTQSNNEISDEIKNVLNIYSGGNYRDPDPYYEEKNITKGLIIDITSDQFDDFDIPVYVDGMSPFHKSFDFISATEHDGFLDERLSRFYHIIEKYLK